MEILVIVFKVIVGLSILNVWLVRSKKSTEWRGGDAKNITEEFQVYGLPKWMVLIVGSLKVALAVLLLASIYYPQFTAIAAYGIAFLMAGAVLMHFKIGDPMKKSFPAFSFLVLSLAIVFL
jgi:uncharacterized membrane protein HdeD (DUF308 family)